MPIPAGPNYPALETITNMVRTILNDSFAGATSTPGEGQILTDQVPLTTTNNPMLLNALNSAIRTLYRKLRNVRTPTLIQDNYILTGLPVVNGPLGASVPDPSVQCYLDNSGFFDGSTNHATFLLPTDILMPLALYERLTGTTDTFIPMTEATNGLTPSDQVDRFVDFEWRIDKLFFRGALTSRDLRIRYAGVFPQFFTPSLSFTTTFIPIMDCEDAVAYITSVILARALGANATIVTTLQGQADSALFDLRNEQVRRMQHQDWKRKGYDDSASASELDIYGI